MRKTVVSKEIIIPFILITSLFSLWGFANAVTDPMVQAFKKVLELSNSQAAWVQMAYLSGNALTLDSGPSFSGSIRNTSVGVSYSK